MKLIKDKRDKEKITLKDLSNKLGISSVYLSEIENCKKDISLKNTELIKNISDFLGQDITEILIKNKITKLNDEIKILKTELNNINKTSIISLNSLTTEKDIKTFILHTYNDVLGTYLPRARVIDERKLNLIFKIDKCFRDEDFWYLFFNEIKSMKFLSGENKSSWRASLSWIIEKDNFVKILNGNYQGVDKNKKLEDLAKRISDNERNKLQDTELFKSHTKLS